MSLLFIGGPWDGKREAVPHDVGYVLNVHEKDEDDFAKTLGHNELSLKTTRYFMSTIGNHTIMLHESNMADPILALIKGYHRHRKPNRFKYPGSWKWLNQ